MNLCYIITKVNDTDFLARGIPEDHILKYGFACEDNELCLTREISADGGSVGRVNGKSAPAALLRALGDVLWRAAKMEACGDDGESILHRSLIDEGYRECVALVVGAEAVAYGR